MYYRSAGLFVVAYGVCWTIAESLSAFDIFRTPLEEYGTAGYLFLVVLSAAITVVAAVLRRYFRPETERVKLCLFGKFLIYLPVYIAQHKGFFEQEGIEAELVDGGGDDLTWKHVRSRRADFGIADPVIMLDDLGDVEGDAGVAIATVVGRAAFWGVSHKNVARVTAPNDLKGKTLSVLNSPSTSHALLRRMIQEMSPARASTVQIKEVAPKSEFICVNSPDIDVAFVLEPTATLAEKDGAHRVFSGPRHFGEFLFTGLFCTKTFLEENRELAIRTVRALQRATDFLRNNHAESLKLAVKVFCEYDPIVVELATLRLLSDRVYSESVAVNESAWYKCVHVRYGKDLSDLPTFEECVDNSCAIEAIKTKDQ